MADDFGYREIVMTELLASEAEQREHITSLEADKAVLREINCALLDVVVRLTNQNTKLVASNGELQDELKRLREELLIEAGAV